MLTLLFSGGHLMWPIVAMSLLVVTFGIERALALRRRKILPPELIHALGRAAEQPGGFDPHRHIGDHPLNRLQLGDRGTKGHPLLGVSN